MKRQAITILVKDIVIAVAAYLIITFFLKESGANVFYGSPMNRMFIGLALAGIPFGYRWASKMFTAISFKGFLIKLLIGVLLGWLAIFVVIIGDVIRCFVAPKSSKE